MAFGFKSSRRQGGSVNSKGINKYHTANGYNTALYAGDPVSLSAGVVVRAVNGDKILGVVDSVSYIDAATKLPIWTTYLPAGTTSGGVLEGDARPMVLVVDDPGATFILQSADALVVSANMVGLTYGVSVGAGNTFTKQSGAVLNIAATTVAEQMVRVLGLYEVPGNVDVSAGFVEVTFTNHY